MRRPSIGHVAVVFLSGVVLCVAVLAPSRWAIRAQSAPQPPQAAVFRGVVEAVLVEVQVVGPTGVPIADLPASSFRVSIDGRRRTVMSAQFVRETSGSGETRTRIATPGPVGRNLWPEEARGPGQTFVLAVDTASLSTGDAANVVTACRRFVDQLAPADAVGIVALPRGVRLSPTTDRAAISGALAKITGQQSFYTNAFHLTPAEVVDISTDLAQPPASLGPVARGGRAQLPVAQNVLQQVQTRECSNTNDSACLAQLIIEAESLARAMEDTVVETFAGFDELLRLLAEYPGRKTVVVLSGGLAVSDRWNQDGAAIRSLGRAAALARSTVYAVHLDSGYRSVYNPQNRSARPFISLGRERAIQERLLADFAVTSGGALFSAPTDAGEDALDRVRRETSAVYVLGVAPEPRDLDGRPHTLEVQVADRGATLRSLRFVVLRSRER